jgi:hypothetical protein
MADNEKLKYGIGGWDSTISEEFIARKYKKNVDGIGNAYWTAEAVQIRGKNRLFSWGEFYYSPTNISFGTRQDVWIDNDKILGKYYKKLSYILHLADDFEIDKKTPEIAAFEANKLVVEIVEDLLGLFSQENSKRISEKNHQKIDAKYFKKIGGDFHPNSEFFFP